MKAMLCAASTPAVAGVLAADLANVARGTHYDETGWLDVQLRACQIVNAQRSVVFVTPDELEARPELVDRARLDGREVLPVPTALGGRLGGATDLRGRPLQSLDVFRAAWSASVVYRFVDDAELAAGERAVWETRHAILAAVGGLPPGVRVRISETLRPSEHEGVRPVGVWDASIRSIMIKRSELARVPAFAGTLLHEYAHAQSGCGDVSRGFELALTACLGVLAARLLMGGSAEQTIAPATTPADTPAASRDRKTTGDLRCVSGGAPNRPTPCATGVWIASAPAPPPVIASVAFIDDIERYRVTVCCGPKRARFLLPEAWSNPGDGDVIAALAHRYAAAAEHAFWDFWRRFARCASRRRALSRFMSRRVDAKRLEGVAGPQFTWVAPGLDPADADYLAVQRAHAWKERIG